MEQSHPGSGQRVREITQIFIRYTLQVTLKEGAKSPNATYPYNNPYQGLYWSSAALAWAHSCGALDNNVTCDTALAATYLKAADTWWRHPDVFTRRTYYPVSNWDVCSSIPLLTAGQLR